MRLVAVLMVVGLQVPVIAGDCNDAGLVNGAVQKAADGFMWGEGPVADANGDIYFSDVHNNKIFKYVVAQKKLVTVRENSGGANGLYFDGQGRLVICEGTSRRVTRMDPNGKITVLADKYDSKKLNSPNDLWIDNKGGIYFTDPRYGDRSGMELPEQVYYIRPSGSGIVRVTDDMVRPNGILASKDGKTLFIADNGGHKVWAYDLDPNGMIGNKRLFAAEGSDGMTADVKGNIYLTQAGVDIYDPAGKKICTIMLPERPTNVEFGGKDKMTLFVTCPKSLYAVPMKIKGI
jgi:gluconolactonase